MSIGAGIGIAGAFLGTALAFLFAPELSGGVFIAPAVVGFFVSMHD